jgi:hypothetical protein
MFLLDKRDLKRLATQLKRDTKVGFQYAAWGAA